MHEMSIAAAICEQVLAVAGQNNLTRVTRVRLRLGQLRLIVPEALEVAWQAARQGSLANDATLEMVDVPARARCKACGHEYEPQWPVFLCPACDKASVEILSGEELILEEITGENAEADESAT
jgi:hydrogenase nickel incorporation protein HypA/HybF